MAESQASALRLAHLIESVFALMETLALPS
jgi:hypothetical protein